MFGFGTILGMMIVTAMLAVPALFVGERVQRMRVGVRVAAGALSIVFGLLLARELIVDGGFYRGTDVIKAIALGATAVGLGRLYCYALAAAGAPGIVRMLELLEDEIRRDLGLMGLDSIRKADKSYICKVPPVRNADVFSAYNLGDIKHEPY